MITLMNIEDELPDECVADICQSGDNQADCEHWVQEMDMKLSNRVCKRLIEESGATFDPEEDNFMLNVRVLWLAAWNRFENDQAQLISEWKAVEV